jgi:hypothetical protein
MKHLLLILLLLLPSIAQANTRDGLVGWWKFDEGSGTVANDSSRQGNTAAFINTPIWTNGPRGPFSLKFNGTNNALNAGSATSIDNLGPLTYALWINPTSLGTGTFGGGEMLDKRYRAFHLSDTRSPTIPIVITMFLSLSVSNAQPYCNNIGITTNQWNHVAVTWDGAIPFTGKFYVNGVACTTAGSTGSGTVSDDSSEDEYIGQRFDASGFFPGSMDDVRIYNRVLTDQEIQDLYNVGTIIRNANLNQ